MTVYMTKNNMVATAEGTNYIVSAINAYDNQDYMIVYLDNIDNEDDGESIEWCFADESLTEALEAYGFTVSK